jgi:isopenicillin N synthase-like dioxygenase
LKEGIYFGQELDPDHPLVVARTPVHGQNLFPAQVPELQDVVLQYIDAVTNVGHALMRGIALSLDLPSNYFSERYTKHPLGLFRIFNYPFDPESATSAEIRWGVGEHTDYGLLTILKQDDSGGLQVKSRSGWIEAPPVKDTFVCNIGDMLDRITKGYYKSTPHRVRNTAAHDRISFPFFFDPSFDSEVRPIDSSPLIPTDVDANADASQRWDATSVHLFAGTYGEYLLHKVGKVFPQLKQEVL